MAGRGPDEAPWRVISFTTISDCGQVTGAGVGQAAQGGHTACRGSGHLGRGQGGHFPIRQGLLHPQIQGGHLGQSDFLMYSLISGIGGTSVLRTYLLISIYSLQR